MHFILARREYFAVKLKRNALRINTFRKVNLEEGHQAFYCFSIGRSDSYQ
jgi:hypothetical protein